MKITVTPYGHGDETELLARGLRPADAAESWKTAGMRPEKALAASLESSLMAATVRIEGKTASILGVASRDPFLHTGTPWLVAHPDFENPAVAVPMARIMRRFLDHWLTIFSRLENYADPNHENALRVLSWAGFEMAEAPYPGPLGHTLTHFWKDTTQ